jgi:hypothetical protein
MGSEFVKQLSKEFALWYTIIGTGIVTMLAIVSYDDPEFGFNSAEYGQGILILFLFPLIWCLILIFCKYIEYKNKRIVELEMELSKLKQGGSE